MNQLSFKNSPNLYKQLTKEMIDPTPSLKKSNFVNLLNINDFFNHYKITKNLGQGLKFFIIISLYKWLKINIIKIL